MKFKKTVLFYQKKLIMFFLKKKYAKNQIDL